MSGILLSSHVSTTPRINRGHPIARGLIGFIHSGPGRTLDLIDSTWKLNKGANNRSINSPYGTCNENTTTNDGIFSDRNSVSTGGNWHVTATPFTLVLFADWAGSAATRFIAGRTDASQGYSLVSAYGTNNRYARVRIGATNYNVDPGSVWTPGMQIRAITCTSSSLRLYDAGNFIASTATAAGSVSYDATFTHTYIGSNTDVAAVLMKSHWMALFDRALTDAEIRSLQQAPFQLYQQKRIWFPVTAGSANTYTFGVSGGFVLSGTAPQIRERKVVPSGGVTFSGTAPQLRERIVIPSGGVVFSGTAPVTNDNVYQLAASGGIDFTGTAAMLRERVQVPSGGVTFGGSARLIFTPIGGARRLLSKLSIGISRALGLS